jgi:hypothetical protein
MSFDTINNSYSGVSDAVKNEYLGAAHVLPFSGLEIKSTFGPEEITKVNEFLAEMKNATNDNNKKAAAIAQYVGVVEKLLKLAKVIV